ncbi:MAG: hypothetical protein U0176_03170 [Bacteroidia bacterium]
MEAIKTAPPTPLTASKAALPLLSAPSCPAEQHAQQLMSEGHTLSGILRFSLLRAIYLCASGTLHWNKAFIANDRKPWLQQHPDGEMPLHFRISYFCLSTVIATLATLAFGWAIGWSHPEMGIWQGGWAMLAIAGPGWLLQGCLAFAARGIHALDYLSHMATVMWKGTVPLALVALVSLVAGPLHPLWFAIAVGISATGMARSHFRRVNALQLSQSWTLAWFLILQITAWSAISLLPFVQPILHWS